MRGGTGGEVDEARGVKRQKKKGGGAKAHLRVVPVPRVRPVARGASLDEVEFEELPGYLLEGKYNKRNGKEGNRGGDVRE